MYQYVYTCLMFLFDPISYLLKLTGTGIWNLKASCMFLMNNQA